jgi:hypothetical protein
MRLFSRQQDDLACFHGYGLASDRNFRFAFNCLHEGIERRGVFT